MEEKPTTVELMETLQERHERKQRELFDSLKSGLVHDPFTVAVFGVTAGKFLIGAAVSIGLSIGSGALARAIAGEEKARGL